MPRAAPRWARARNEEGVVAKTSRTVSLNCRTLRKASGEGHIGEGQPGGLDEQSGGLGPLGPGQGQWAGADLGPQVPFQLAVLYPSRSANPVTPSRSTTPSAINRMARPTMSRRTFHSGDPGEASGRQRLQARNPACCAAAAVGRKRRLRAKGGRTGQLGRQ